MTRETHLMSDVPLDFIVGHIGDGNPADEDFGLPFDAVENFSVVHVGLQLEYAGA
jgi:hypothetical protein